MLGLVISLFNFLRYKGGVYENLKSVYMQIFFFLM